MCIRDSNASDNARLRRALFGRATGDQGQQGGQRPDKGQPARSVSADAIHHAAMLYQTPGGDKWRLLVNT